MVATEVQEMFQNLSLHDFGCVRCWCKREIDVYITLLSIFEQCIYITYIHILAHFQFSESQLLLYLLLPPPILWVDPVRSQALFGWSFSRISTISHLEKFILETLAFALVMLQKGLGVVSLAITDNKWGFRFSAINSWSVSSFHPCLDVMKPDGREKQLQLYCILNTCVLPITTKPSWCRKSWPFYRDGYSG